MENYPLTLMTRGIISALKLLITRHWMAMSKYLPPVVNSFRNELDLRKYV